MNPTTRAPWHLSPARIFWGEIAPSEHVVQVYENEHVFLDTLAGFVGSGINEGDTIIVIATAKHLLELESRLESLDVHVDTLIAQDSYIPLNAQQTLAKFMVNNWPDEQKFNETISTILNRVQKRNRKVRAFGEMVALLWAEGHNGATVQLEHLWNGYMKKHSFSLYCAYPKSGFTEDPIMSIRDICGCHSQMISGTLSSMEHVYHKVVPAR